MTAAPECNVLVINGGTQVKSTMRCTHVRRRTKWWNGFVEVKSGLDRDLPVVHPAVDVSRE